MSVSLAVNKVTKRFGYHRALAGVDFNLESGRLCALLGPNGAGKSTLLGILSTLVRPTSGGIEYRRGDVSIPHGAELRMQIGVLAHESFMYGELTGWENLQFYGNLYQLDDVDGRAAQLLDEVALDDKVRHRLARTYSRGMMQRLALARALLHDPEILLLDEPFTGLDRAGAAALSKTLAAGKARGKLQLVVTHDLESLGGLADHVVVLRRGKVVHEQRAEEPLSYEALKDVYHRYTE